MNRRAHILAAAGLAAVFLTLIPEPAEAQRRAVRGVRPRAAVTVGVGVGIGVGVGVYRRYRPYYRPYVYDPWYWDPFYYQAPPYYGYRYDLSGSLRLQVAPRETQVFINGYYAGTVDDFDGVFQRLRLEPGEHDLELYLPGHRSVQQRVYLQPGRTFRVRQTMVPLGPGEAEPPRPAGQPVDPAQGRALPPADPAASPRRQAPPRGRGPAAESGFGSVSFRVQPADAEILIDGERWQGDAGGDRLVVQVGAGVHRVEIRREGYRTYLTEMTVRPGETLPLNVAMTRQ